MAVPAGNPPAAPVITLATLSALLTTLTNKVDEVENKFVQIMGDPADPTSGRLAALERRQREIRATKITSENFIQSNNRMVEAVTSLARAVAQSAPRRTSEQMHWFKKLLFGNALNLPNDLASAKLGTIATNYVTTIGTWLAVPYGAGKAVQTAANAMGFEEDQAEWTQWACSQPGINYFCSPIETFSSINVKTGELAVSLASSVFKKTFSEVFHNMNEGIFSNFEGTPVEVFTQTFNNVYTYFNPSTTEQQAQNPESNTFSQSNDFTTPTRSPFLGENFQAPAPPPFVNPPPSAKFTTPTPPPASNLFLSENFQAPTPASAENFFSGESFNLGAQSPKTPKSDWKPLALLVGTIALVSIATSQAIRYFNDIQAVENPKQDTIDDEQLTQP